MKKRTLPSIRISEEDYEAIEKAVATFNTGNILEMSIASFRRLSYKLLAQLISEGRPLPLIFKGSEK